MRIGIVGSRFFGTTPAAGQEMVELFVWMLPDDWIVVSGDGVGPDRWAAAAAREMGMMVVEHKPRDDLYPYAVARKERNKLVAADVDVLVAFWDGVSGGTLDTFQRVIARRRPAKMVREGDPLPTVEELQRLAGCA